MSEGEAADLRRRLAELGTDALALFRKRVDALTDGAPPDETAELVFTGVAVVAAGYLALRRRDKDSVAVMLATLRMARRRPVVVDG